MNIISQQITPIKKYIASQVSRVGAENFPLQKLDYKKLEGIQTGIPVFNSSSISEISFISKWFNVLNIARGCVQQCTFCLRNAKAPIKETAEQINSILWEDLQRFTRGICELNNRLGLNILKGNPCLSLFEDANLPVAKIKDLNGRVYNTKDTVKEIYDSLDMPVVFATSGWNSKDKFSQNTAEELCKYLLNNKGAIHEFDISVNPFFSMPKERYIEQVANAIKTFLPLYNDNSNIGKILFKYNFPDGLNADKTGFEAARELYLSIYKRLQALTGSNLEMFSSLKPENVAIKSQQNLIENKGKGQRFFAPEIIAQNNRKLFAESFSWLIKTPEQKQKFAYDNTIKNVDINGNVYLITPSEQCIPTNINLNYINSNKKTAPIHSDIQFQKLNFLNS